MKNIEMEKKCTALDNQIDELLRIFKILNRTVEDLKESNKVQQKIITQLQEQNEQLQRQQEIINQLQEENEELKTLNQTVKGLTESNKRQQEINAQLQEDNEQLKRTLESQATNVDDIRDKVFLHENKTFPIDRTEQLVSSLIDAGIGSTYIRWGRADCPGNGSKIVYSGYIGGSNYIHSGAASNNLCLPNEPQYDKYVSDLQDEGRIYGAEYHAKNSETFFGRELQYHVPRCAVCRSPRNSVVMIPARTTCYDGWTKEFGGYLVSGHRNHKAASEYICLDNNATFTGWSESETQYGRLLYMVEGKCDHNLKCPPYETRKELTCVVCSK